jgi:hypothetical protein
MPMSLERALTITSGNGRGVRVSFRISGEGVETGLNDAAQSLSCSAEETEKSFSDQLDALVNVMNA